MNERQKIEKIRKDLFEMADKKYADFHAGLIPNIERELIIGVRTPILRKYASDIFETDNAKAFLNILPHTYYEENNLHAFLLCKIRDIDILIKETDRFLPFINNWATCDSMRPKIFEKHKDRLFLKIKQWMKSKDTYTLRFAVEMLMIHFLSSDFSEEYPKIVAEIKSDEYYVNMMRAWYFAEALVKRYEIMLPYFYEKKLDVWTHNKAIQKAVESFRITAEQKIILKSLKI